MLDSELPHSSGNGAGGMWLVSFATIGIFCRLPNIINSR